MAEKVGRGARAAAALRRPTSVRRLSPSQNQVPFPLKLGVGAIAGILGTSGAFPMDTVKVTLMNQRRLPNGEGTFAPLSTRCRDQNLLPQGSWNTDLLGNASALSLLNEASPGCTGVRQSLENTGSLLSLACCHAGLSANLMGVTPEKAIKLSVNDNMREYFARQNRINGLRGGAGDGLTTTQAVLSGCLAGLCQCIATNPMEIVKIRLQLFTNKRVAAQQVSVAEQGSLVEVVRHLGLRGLYRGTAATLIRDIPFSALFFPLFGVLDDAFNSALGPRVPGGGVSPGTLAAGMISGGFSAAICTPMDVIKTRLQAAGGNKLYSGYADCARKTYRSGGVKAFFRGWIPRTIATAPLFGISMLAYEALKSYWMSRSTDTASSRM
jgi:hypothetical protein